MGKIIRRDRNGKPYFKAPPPPDRSLLEQDDGLNRKIKFQHDNHISTGRFYFTKNAFFEVIFQAKWFKMCIIQTVWN